MVKEVVFIVFCLTAMIFMFFSSCVTNIHSAATNKGVLVLLKWISAFVYQDVASNWKYKPVRHAQFQSQILLKGDNTMKKKVLYVGGGAAAVMLLLALLFGSDATSYVTTSVASVRDSVKNSVPVEFELERARQEISDVTPEIRKNMELIAREEVEIEKLESNIAQFEEKLAVDEKSIKRLNADLSSGVEYVTYHGIEYSANDVKRDLTNRFDEFKTDNETIANLRKLHVTRMDNLKTVRGRLASMQASQRKLRVEIENLAARNKMIEVTKSASEYEIDDSQLAKANALIDNLDSRLSTEEKMSHVTNQTLDRIPVETETKADILDEVANYFDSPEKTSPKTKLAGK